MNCDITKLDAITQASLTNYTLAAEIIAIRKTRAAILTESEKIVLRLVAVRLETCPDPTIHDIMAYELRRNVPFESPIDNEL